MMNEIDFLKDMVKDSQRHINVIKKRINELDEENGEGETKKEIKGKGFLGRIVDGITKTYS